MMSNYRRYNAAAAETTLPQPPVVPPQSATLTVSAADADALGGTGAHRQQQQSQAEDFPFADYPAPGAAASASAAPEAAHEPTDASAMQYLIAQRLAAAVAADRTERIAHERLLRDLRIIQEHHNRQQEPQKQHSQQGRGNGRLPPQSYETYPPSAVHSECRQEAAFPPPPPPSTFPAIRGYEPYQSRQVKPVDRTYPPAPFHDGSPAAPHPPGGANDDSAETLRAEAEACMALSLLGGRGRRLSVATVGGAAASFPAATPAVVGPSNAQGASPTQRIVSPGASPSPPLSHQDIKKKGTKKAAGSGASAKRPSSGPLKKRKKIEGPQGASGAGAEADASKEQQQQQQPPKKKSKKGRKKENGMPRRPLSAYNIFFSEERERILGDIPVDGPQQRSTAERTILERRFSNPSVAAAAAASGTTQGEQTQTSNANRRRKHRRTHGKIGFRDLARTIGQRWKTLPDDRMARYKSLAKIDMDRYQEELSVYRREKMIREVAAKENAQGTQKQDALTQRESTTQPPSRGVDMTSLMGRE